MSHSDKSPSIPLFQRGKITLLRLNRIYRQAPCAWVGRCRLDERGRFAFYPLNCDVLILYGD